MLNKLKEKIDIFTAKSPKKAVLISIMLYNAVFILFAAGVIFTLSKFMSGIKQCSFWETVYYTITMILDAGCINNIIADVGKAGVVVAVISLMVVIMGMILFTGAVIGYITNTISDYIESKNNGRNKLAISDHVVIINWNYRALEIINEMLYERKKEKIVVFVPDGKDEIDEKISDRLEYTIKTENQKIIDASQKMPFIEGKMFVRKNSLKDDLTVIVREGDVNSSVDLDNICINYAKTVIILEDDNEVRTDGHNKYEHRGNARVIKTLAKLTDPSVKRGISKKQTIIVEITDKWTEDIVERIIENKCTNADIVPITFDKLTGQIISQLTLMPEFIYAYDYLLSNRTALFVSQEVPEKYLNCSNDMFAASHLENNCLTLPLTILDTSSGERRAYYRAQKSQDISMICNVKAADTAKLKMNYSIGKRNIVIIGHNSRIDLLLESLKTIGMEWSAIEGKDILDVLNVIIINDRKTLEQHSYYKQYPFVTETYSDDIDDIGMIDRHMQDLYQKLSSNITVLILSNDEVPAEYIDSAPLTSLIYIRKLAKNLSASDSDERKDNVRVIVEVLDPKNIDAFKNYGADEVIFSNRYISKIIAGISAEETICDLFREIFSYDSNLENRSSELYIQSADMLFEEIPEKCTASQLIRKTFNAGEEGNKIIILGYIRNNKDYIFFDGDQRLINVELEPEDKLILFCNREGKLEIT